jgi:putative phage-type endonuclease
MKIIDLKQNTPEWLEFRKTKIGASDAPIIMGVSPWKNTHQLYWEKMNPFKNQKTFSYMQRGHDLEPIARKQFEDKFDMMVFPTVIQHKDYDWMIASLDGLSFDKDCFVEIKCPGKHDHALAMMGIIPDHYKPQLQHQIACTGLSFGYYQSSNGKTEVTIRVPRDDVYIDQLIEEEKKFYDCLISGREPENPELKKYKKNETDEWITKTEAYKNIENVLKSIVGQRDELEKEKNRIKDELVALSGQLNTMGNGIKLSKIVRKGSIDCDKLYQKEKINIDLYRKEPIEYWNVQIVTSD